VLVNPETQGQFVRLRGHTDIISGAIELPGNQLVSWSRDCDLRLWDLISHECIHTLEGHKSGVEGAVSVSPDRIVSWSQNGTLRMWSLNSGKCLSCVRDYLDASSGKYMDYDSEVEEALLHENGNWKAANLRFPDGGNVFVRRPLILPQGWALSRIESFPHILSLVDVLSGSLLATLQGHGGEIDGLQPLPDGRIVSWVDGVKPSEAPESVGYEAEIFIWDLNAVHTKSALESQNNLSFLLNTPTKLAPQLKLKGQRDYIRVVVVDAARIVSWTSNGLITVWNPRTGNRMATLAGHEEIIIGVLLLKNGRLLSWCFNNEMRLWDLEDGKCLNVFTGHTARINGVLELVNERIVTWS
jgi:WD40 repeat protein